MYRNCLGSRPKLLIHAYCRYSILSSVNNSGPRGINGRLPSYETVQDDNISTSLTITDPFLLYQNYISQGILDKDEAQLRVMKEFQKLYFRLKDYKPPDEIGVKINLLLRKLELKQAEEELQERSHKSSIQKLSRLLFSTDISKERKEIIKVITDEEELYNIESPQGLLLNGEVGCGKSMLMDIFAATLPHESKMRWHYNNFILWVFNELHKLQNDRMLLRGTNKSLDHEFILFEIAQKLINKSNILLLDEFVLPDIAAANIVKILFTYYFKLGGVLVATLNKLPEELYSNEFHKKNFRSFVAILHSRCQTVDMRSDIDYRLKKSSGDVPKQLVVKQRNVDHETEWIGLIKTVTTGEGISKTITVYNRSTRIPLTYNGTTCHLDFPYICEGLFSASDYISIASTFDTIILDNVPVLTTKKKNEARRFITFLDAIYEAKCQFFMRSEVDILELFFPDEKEEPSGNEVQDSEMYAKTIMDLENPYRPNVSYYTGGNSEFKVEAEKPRNFQNTSAFTGEDEKFAYKRALLRIQEMVGSELWRKNQWVPIDDSMRPWETNQVPNVESRAAEFGKEVKISDSPLIEEEHIWSMGRWTKLNGRRVKDEITKRWIRSGAKDVD